MKAVVLEHQGLINIREVPDVPAPGPGELRIAPHTVGICGSDVHYYTHGRIGQFVVKAPMILGHEAAGTVLEVGPGVTDFKPGDRVAMEPGIPDMTSRASRMGMYNVDPAVRFFATPPVDGCLCEQVIHPAAFTYKLPDSMSFGEGALLEPLSVGMHSATKAGIKPGDIAVVAGSGTVGILTAASALAAGAAKVYVSDVSDVKLDIVSQIPGVVPVDLKKEDLVEKVKDETGGWGADVVFECSGAEKSFETILEVGAPGNTTVFVGMPVDKVPFDVVAAQARETTIMTIFRYRNVYQKAIDLVAAGKLDLKPFITKTYAMDDSIAAFKRVEEVHPEDVKIQITVDQQ
ncbi:NAD(P)-dependent alcohol dehydrogenase [Bifidobacterium catulorum]|uniref:NAD(P)-dependent alcohol dehydrogenase n=1 Tax=Bifidobacterium catulorum TaxID=1630173 RepID=A0A2U2MSN4_9BIFI|nr:NAD(P)-dependent alcohol dehydrogenase [Bifidobacterium catulorum]PWG59867.1 NAD(P)-dependent alcohol dehydrogenase [Bifidobacterium catulorum]